MAAMSCAACCIAAATAGLGRLIPVTFRTNWVAAASISSSVADGSRPRSSVMFRHMTPNYDAQTVGTVDAVDVNDVLIESFDRIPDLVDAAVDGLTPEQLRWAPARGANSIGWLVWHLTRVQDHHVAELLDTDQVWIAPGWADRFGLKPDPSNTGYAHSAEQVAAVKPENAQALVDYYTAVAARTRDYLRRLKPADLDRVVDERWDPPVTLGVRLVSVIDDDVQHAGQAAYVRGLLKTG
jgi:uncharacterized damage-inducible protein DinB